MCVLDDLYESARFVPMPDVEIEPAGTTTDVSSMVSSKSSPAVVDADPSRASAVRRTPSPARVGFVHIVWNREQYELSEW